MNRREGASAMYGFSKRRTCINRLSVNLLLREYYNLSTATALSCSVPPSAWLTDPVLCYICIWSVYAQPVLLNTWCGTTEQERVMFQMPQVYSEDIVPSYERYTSLLVEWQLHCTGSSSFSKMYHRQVYSFHQQAFLYIPGWSFQKTIIAISAVNTNCKFFWMLAAIFFLEGIMWCLINPNTIFYCTSSRFQTPRFCSLALQHYIYHICL